MAIVGKLLLRNKVALVGRCFGQKRRGKTLRFSHCFSYPAQLRGSTPIRRLGHVYVYMGSFTIVKEKFRTYFFKRAD